MKILIAGIGNLFLGDDGWGCAVAEALGSRHVVDEQPNGARWPSGAQVTVRDYGIRGMDLAFALTTDFDAAILVDAMPRGSMPGTIHVIEPVIDDAPPAIDNHAMDPVAVLRLARSLEGTGNALPRMLRVVGCEPTPLGVATNARSGGDFVATVASDAADAFDAAVPATDALVATHDLVGRDDLVPGLSAAVEAAIGPAVVVIRELVEDLLREHHRRTHRRSTSDPAASVPMPGDSTEGRCTS